MNVDILIQRIPGYLVGLIIALFSLPVSAQAILTEGTNISPDASAANGRIAFDLLGGIWILPASGGQAQELPNTIMPARLPSLLAQYRGAWLGHLSSRSRY